MKDKNTPINYKFERIEKKFRMTAEQYSQFKSFLDRNFQVDAYGQALICNIYYDTPDYALIRRSVERPDFKEKLRIRSYGYPTEDSPVFVEIKRKLSGIGYKRRLRLPYSLAKQLCCGLEIGSDQPQIEKEVLEFIRRYHPQPVTQLTYKRTAYTCDADPNLRVTIDMDMGYRLGDLQQVSDEGIKPLLQEADILLEIKTSGAIPLWFSAELSHLKIYQAPFSKIGTCYTKYIAPGTHYPKQN